MNLFSGPTKSTTDLVTPLTTGICPGSRMLKKMCNDAVLDELNTVIRQGSTPIGDATKGSPDIES